MGGHHDSPSIKLGDKLEEAETRTAEWPAMMRPQAPVVPRAQLLALCSPREPRTTPTCRHPPGSFGLLQARPPLQGP